jgi:hypothetical protein
MKPNQLYSGAGKLGFEGEVLARKTEGTSQHEEECGVSNVPFSLFFIHIDGKWILLDFGSGISPKPHVSGAHVSGSPVGHYRRW